MPIYEYKCSEHGKFEAIRGIEHDIDPCPQCGVESKRVPSMFKIKKFTRIDQADGEGFTQRWTPNAEIAEKRKGYQLGQSEGTYGN